MYENGLGVTRDRAEAVHWYRKASDQGHKAAEIRLKKIGAWKGAATGGKSGQSAGAGQSGAPVSGNTVAKLRARAKAGHAKAQTSLGFMYERGQGVLLVFYRKVRQEGFRSGRLLVAQGRRTRLRRGRR